jgi:hypothetical protein
MEGNQQSWEPAGLAWYAFVLPLLAKVTRQRGLTPRSRREESKVGGGGRGFRVELSRQRRPIGWRISPSLEGCSKFCSLFKKVWFLFFSPKRIV